MLSESKLKTQDKSTINSIIKSKENYYSKELNKLENKLKLEFFSKLTTKGKKRYTIDNKLCKNPFKHNNDFFFDCINTETPDKSQTGKEWCYIDSPKEGDKIWEFCIPILDYDKLRENVQKQLKNISIEAEKLTDEVRKVHNPAQNALDELRKIKDSQTLVSTKLAELSKDIENLSYDLNNLNDLKNRWKSLEDISCDVAQEIENKVKNKILLESNNFNKLQETSSEVIRAEESYNNQKINPSLQYKLLDNSFDCQGKLIYEDEGSGDGVIAQYYDNPDFLGESTELKERKIDFDWSLDNPPENINPSVFSALFVGYILAPLTSNYLFSLECDDSCQLSVNYNILISHKMNFASVDSKQRVDKWLNREVSGMISHSGQIYKSKSKPIYLVGGTKYKVEIRYSHSTHNDSQNLGKSFLKLLWNSDEFQEKIISQKNLFSQNANPPIKINSEHFPIRKLIENDLAFKDSAKYILQDIPNDYVGSTCLKLNTKFKEASINFEVNIPTYVYIGRFEHYPKSIFNDWENTGERLSILEISQKPNSVDRLKFESIRSGVMKIYRKKFDAGFISIPLNRQYINSKGIPLVIFFGSDNLLLNQISCGGKELWVSDPNSESFSECSTSSFYDNNWKCQNGLNGKERDLPGGMWATKREGIGAWIEVNFKNTYHLTRVEIKNRRNSQERNSLLEISFANSKKQIVKLPNSDDIMNIPLDPPMKSNKLRFTIKGVYGTVNNGGSFKVFGVECKNIDNDSSNKINPTSLSPLFKEQDRPPVVLLCKDSLSNTKNLGNVKFIPGNQVKVKCLDTCIDSRNPVYGDMKYSKDSSICKAAFHSGVLFKPGEVILVKFDVGMNNYKSQLRNGIKSKSKSFSELTISFDESTNDDAINIRNGTKIDILDPNGSGTWLPALISDITDSGEQKKLTCTVENNQGISKKLVVNYPNKSQVKPCGSKIKKRECKGSSGSNQKPIRIKFQPENYTIKTPDFIDSGLPFGKNGKSYGWDRDMTNRVLLKGKNNDPILETLVEFPPDQNSKFCNVEKPDVACDKASWSAKVGFGKFNVKLFIGDLTANTRIDLTVNDEPFINQTTIEKGKLEVFEGVFDSVNQLITLSSKCKNDCEYSIAKINLVQITPIIDSNLGKEEPEPIVEDPCGNSKFGGKCDTGPDVTNCLFDDPTNYSAKYCSGNTFIIQVPANYKCPSQRNKFKCVLRKFESQSNCLENCPVKCFNAICDT